MVFRYDDFSADLPEYRQQDPLRQEIWDIEKKMDELFRKYDVPYHLAIIPNRYDYNTKMEIPFTADLAKIDLVKKGIADGVVEVSQHGYTHQLRTPAGHRGAEFRHRSPQQQLHDILDGKKILEQALSTKISIFVPPWNGWDKNTGKLLTDAGYSFFSADQYYDYDSIKSMKIVPFTVVLNQLEKMDFNSIPDETIVTVLFHPPDLIPSSRHFSIDRLDALLKKLSCQPDIRITTFSYLSRHYNLDFNVYIQVHRDWLINNYFTPVLHTEPFFFYPTNMKQVQMKRHLMVFYILNISVILLSLLAGYFVTLYFSRQYSFKIINRLLFSIVIVISLWTGKVLHVLYKGFHVNMFHVVPLLVMCGIFLSLLLNIRKKRRLLTVAAG